ncbi:L-seryl-tRNA(Sec) selenium transferase, partial [bacterium]
MEGKQSLLRRLPAISHLLETEEIADLIRRYSHKIVSEAAGEVVEGLRKRILAHGEEDFDTREAEPGLIIRLINELVQEKTQPHLRKVINATGIVLHTNLGRAVLAREAVAALAEIAGSYNNLELDLATGERGSRYVHVADLLCRLTGAEAGMVVNNNAAAVLLVLSALAKGQQVIVSRGQLVEIGGSFRIPEVMAQSGAVLVEVGATNKTHLRDYEHAVTEETALLLKVHTSNYKIVGFTAEVDTKDLARLGHSKEIPVFEDLGSGVLVDLSAYGLAKEPTVQESLRAGVDIVTCSGDKLFGGPQAGIIVGRRELIEKLKKHPLARALRVDKFTLAAMETTLRLYLDEKTAVSAVPTLRMLTMAREELDRRAKNFARKLQGRNGITADVDIPAAPAAVEVIDGFSQVGGGALPEENIPTRLVAVIPRHTSVNS